MAYKFLARSSHIAIVLMTAFIVMGCAAAVSSPGTLPPTSSSSPTAISTSAPNGNPTSCFGGYTWAYGSVSPEFLTQLQDAMAASGLEGSVEASTFGENNGCGQFLARDVDYVFTVQVEDLEATEDLAGKASLVLDIATRFVDASPAPNLGKLGLTFQGKDGRQCGWFYEAGAWNAVTTSGENFVACPAPVSAETERLAAVLTALSVDLACETSSVTANTEQAVLECERPEGKDRYLVTVTFRLNEQGYEGDCFHGYNAFESSMTGDEPMTVTENGETYFERDRSFQWTANGVLFDLFERIKGGPDVAYPPDTREKIYLQAVQAGLIPGEGSDCRK